MNEKVKKALMVCVVALLFLDKGADKIIKLIKEMASSRTVADLAMMILANLIRGPTLAI